MRLRANYEHFLARRSGAAKDSAWSFRPAWVGDVDLHPGGGAALPGLSGLKLLRPDRIVGALVVRRKEPGVFPESTIDLLQTFAAQSVLAIQNARLFEDVGAR